jgi:hypothetical protein
MEIADGNRRATERREICWRAAGSVRRTRVSGGAATILGNRRGMLGGEHRGKT